MISMKEIADVCRVSPGTVSKALSNSDGVGSDTRTRILRVAKQFNYLPNALVRSIQSGQSMTVAVACNAVDDPWGALVMRGILETLEKHHLEALVFNWDSGVRDGEHMLRSMGERRVDGLLMFPPAQVPPSDYLMELRTFHRPIVLIDQQWPHSEFDFVGTDDAVGTRAVTEHILGLGHVHIANLHYAQASSGRIRLDTFLQVMAEHGIPMRPQWIGDCQVDFDTAYRQTSQWLSASPRPTAIICFNDVVAMAAMAAAHDLGVRIPEQLSVTGFCDLPIAAQIRPALTTVQQNAITMGREAATALVQEISMRHADTAPESASPPAVPARRRPRSILLPTALVVRGSTGPAPTP